MLQLWTYEARRIAVACHEVRFVLCGFRRQHAASFFHVWVQESFQCNCCGSMRRITHTEAVVQCAASHVVRVGGWAAGQLSQLLVRTAGYRTIQLLGVADGGCSIYAAGPLSVV